jgi:hypothetical protein
VTVAATPAFVVEPHPTSLAPRCYLPILSFEVITGVLRVVRGSTPPPPHGAARRTAAFT